MHLTNYSVNKKSSSAKSSASPSSSGAAGVDGGAAAAEEEDKTATKWSFAALKEHVVKEGRVEWSHVWQQVWRGGARGVGPSAFLRGLFLYSRADT